MNKTNKLVCGKGINDAAYPVQPTIDGKIVPCPYYVKWKSMLERCYSEKYHKVKPTYENCTVCDDWILFSNFRQWMIQQRWEGKSLDKDFLFEDNKVYSPEKCVFISSQLNSFITDCGKSRGDHPIGVYFNKPTGKFQTRCHNPFTKKLVHLGYYNTPEEAHKAWKKYKNEMAIQYAELQTDDRIKEVLLTKFK